ncbi:UNVERIFIED_CONTAM: hypothetical protein K2H54_071207 [Gekko kuhli]
MELLGKMVSGPVESRPAGEEEGHRLYGQLTEKSFRPPGRALITSSASLRLTLQQIAAALKSDPEYYLALGKKNSFKGHPWRRPKGISANSFASEALGFS